MDEEDILDLWTRFHADLGELVDRRTSLETELSEVGTKISHIEQILNHLAPMAGLTLGSDISGLGITEAIRAVLRGSEARMTANDVRRVLGEKGFSLAGLTAPMASVYKVLSRLVESGEAIREKEETDNRTVFYRWKKANEITDDDIPF